MNKFKIEKEEYVFSNIRFPKELWEKVNKEKGRVHLQNLSLKHSNLL